MSMLTRCYSSSYKEISKTYQDVRCCDEWLMFSNFKRWAESYEKEYSVDVASLCLDKDIINSGKIYSPTNCVFVNQQTNKFITTSKATRGVYMLGVDLHKESGKFRARCSNQITGRCEHLGYFYDELSAHKAWQSRKHEIALQLALMQHDDRVSSALRVMYTFDKDYTNI